MTQVYKERYCYILYERSEIKYFLYKTFICPDYKVISSGSPHPSILFQNIEYDFTLDFAGNISNQTRDKKSLIRKMWTDKYGEKFLVIIPDNVLVSYDLKLQHCFLKQTPA